MEEDYGRTQKGRKRPVSKASSVTWADLTEFEPPRADSVSRSSRFSQATTAVSSGPPANESEPLPRGHVPWRERPIPSPIPPPPSTTPRTSLLIVRSEDSSTSSTDGADNEWLEIGPDDSAPRRSAPPLRRYRVSPPRGPSHNDGRDDYSDCSVFSGPGDTDSRRLPNGRLSSHRRDGQGTNNPLQSTPRMVNSYPDRKPENHASIQRAATAATSPVQDSNAAPLPPTDLQPSMATATDQRLKQDPIELIESYVEILKKEEERKLLDANRVLTWINQRSR